MSRWYQHDSHAQCMHIIHGLTLRLTVQAEIQLWDKRRYLSSRKRGWGDNIPDKREEKARHRQTQRKKQKQEERDNETCMKNLNHGGRQGLVKAHCSSSAVCDCASEHAVSCMKWVLRSLSSKLLSHYATKTASSHTLIATTRPCFAQNHYSQHMDLCCNSCLNWEVKTAVLYYLLL